MHWSGQDQKTIAGTDAGRWYGQEQKTRDGTNPGHWTGQEQKTRDGTDTVHSEHRVWKPASVPRTAFFQPVHPTQLQGNKMAKSLGLTRSFSLPKTYSNHRYTKTRPNTSLLTLSLSVSLSLSLSVSVWAFFETRVSNLMARAARLPISITQKRGMLSGPSGCSASPANERKALPLNN